VACPDMGQVKAKELSPYLYKVRFLKQDKKH